VEKKNASKGFVTALAVASVLVGCGGGSSGGFATPTLPPTAIDTTTGVTPTGTTPTSTTPTSTTPPEVAPEQRVDIALTPYVNLFVGTKISDTGSGHSGNVNPGAQAPFGMVSFGPDTRGSGQPWGYGSGGYNLLTDATATPSAPPSAAAPSAGSSGGAAATPAASASGDSTSSGSSSMLPLVLGIGALVVIIAVGLIVMRGRRGSVEEE